MRGAGDDHSSAQEGGGGGRHPGPLGILSGTHGQEIQLSFLMSKPQQMYWLRDTVV